MHVLTTISKYVDIAGPLLGILLCLYWYRKKQKAGGYFIILGYLLLQLTANGVAKVMMHFKTPNIRVYQVNAFFSLLIISIWFYDTFKRKLPPHQLKIFCVYSIGSLCLSLLLIWHEDVNSLNSLSLSFTALIICLHSVLFYLSSLFNVTENDLLRSPVFWRASSIFLYYCSCFFIYVTFKFFAEKGGSNFMIIWNIQNVILFVSCIILGLSSRFSTKGYSDGR
jgi:hypothetical protein